MPCRSMPYLQKVQAVFPGHLSLLQKIIVFADFLANTERSPSIPLQIQHPELYLLHPKLGTKQNKKNTFIN